MHGSVQLDGSSAVSGVCARVFACLCVLGGLGGVRGLCLDRVDVDQSSHQTSVGKMCGEKEQDCAAHLPV